MGVIRSMDMLASSMVEYLSINSGLATGGFSSLANRCCIRKHKTAALVEMAPFLASLYSGRVFALASCRVLAALLSAVSTRFRSWSILMRSCGPLPRAFFSW